MAIIFKISVLQNTQKPYDRNGDKTGRFLLSKYGSSQNFKTLPIFKSQNFGWSVNNKYQNRWSCNLHCQPKYVEM